MARRVPRHCQPTEPIDLGGCDRRALLAMAEAAREVLEIERLLAKTGDNVVGEILRQHAAFYEWDHYPPGDVFDPETGAQYYYHAHEAADRFADEHGHFHTFLRPKAAPRSHRAGPTAERLCHLVAISMTAEGEPFRLFTVNRWVTGETWYSAAEAVASLDRFSVELTWPSWPTNRWIGAILRLFRPQIESLILARDQAVAAWRRRHPGRDVLEDRALEVTSYLDVSLAAQVTGLERSLGDPPILRR